MLESWSTAERRQKLSKALLTQFRLVYNYVLARRQRCRVTLVQAIIMILQGSRPVYLFTKLFSKLIIHIFIESCFTKDETIYFMTIFHDIFNYIHISLHYRIQISPKKVDFTLWCLASSGPRLPASLPSSTDNI